MFKEIADHANFLYHCFPAGLRLGSFRDDIPKNDNDYCYGFRITQNYFAVYDSSGSSSVILSESLLGGYPQIGIRRVGKKVKSFTYYAIPRDKIVSL